MTWLALILLAAVALAPLAISLRGRAGPRARREAALALHRAQLGELDRDRDEGRLSAAEHAAAVLEVQRRLLSAADLPESDAGAGHRWPVLAMLLVIPAVGVALYLIHGHPALPGAPMAQRLDAADRSAAQDAMLIDTLRARLQQLDPHSNQAREGYLLLGRAEDARGNLPGAVDAWQHAVAIRFEPGLAALTAEAQTRLDGGHISPASMALFNRALAEGPPDAPWRKLVRKRLDEAAK